MIKIVVDLLGADKPQTELVLGAIRAISENKDLYVYLMGRKTELEDFLANVTYDESQLEIVDCTQEITNYDDPVDAYHDKTDSSLIKGLKMCRMNEDIGGFVTCGATGVVLISSILILGKLNATRPALSVVLNGRNDKPFCIVDCGANIDCKADRFVDFARLGVAYMKTLGIENPTVANFLMALKLEREAMLLRKLMSFWKNVVLISQVILKAKKCWMATQMLLYVMGLQEMCFLNQLKEQQRLCLTT